MRAAGRSGGREDAPWLLRTVGHAHGVLHAVLVHAAKLRLVSRNVAGRGRAAEGRRAGVAGACRDLQIAGRPHRLVDNTYALSDRSRRARHRNAAWRVVRPAMGGGRSRPGEVSVERSLEQTDAGLRLKSPKSRHGRRRIALPASCGQIFGSVASVRSRCGSPSAWAALAPTISCSARRMADRGHRIS